MRIFVKDFAVIFDRKLEDPFSKSGFLNVLCLLADIWLVYKWRI